MNSLERIAAAAAFGSPDRVPVVAQVFGHAAVLAGVGVGDDEPEQFGQLLDFATAVATRFGIAQIRAGAHLPLVFDPSASPEVLPAQFYREFLLPRLTRLFGAFKAAGAPLNWLHTAGVDIANLDFSVDPERALRALPHTCLDGNLRPLAFVCDAPADIAAASARLLDLFAARGGFILSSGCEIPPEARPENITAMVTAARRVG